MPRAFVTKRRAVLTAQWQGEPTWHPQAHLLPVHTYSGNQIKISKCLYCRLGATSPQCLGPGISWKTWLWWVGTPSSNKPSSWELPPGQNETNHHQFAENYNLISSAFWETNFRLVQLRKRGLSSIVTFSLKPTQPSLTAACLTYLHFYTTLSCYFLPHLLPIITSHFLIRHCSLKFCSILFARKSV